MRPALQSTAAGLDLVGMIQALIRSEISKVRVAEIAVITASYPSPSDGNYACDIKLRDTGLELKKVPIAVPRIGFAAIPNVNDLVLVQFVGGNMHGAIITGRLYNDVDRPPESKVHEMVYQCPDDSEDGIRRAYLEFPGGNSLTLTDGSAVLDWGGTSVTLESGGDAKIVVKGKLSIKVDDDVKFEAGGDMVLEAAGKMKLMAGSDMKLEGLTIAAKAQTSAQMEGGASATVKGSTVTVSGMINFSAG